MQVLSVLILGSPAALAAADMLWQFKANGRVIGKPTVAEERVYIAGGATVHALDLSGVEQWRRELAGNIAAAITVDGEHLFVHSSAGLHALTDEGEDVWFFERQDLGPLVDGRTWGWGNEVLADPWGWYRSAPMVHGDIVAFGSSDGVHAVSKQTGEALWHVPVGPVTADLVAHNDTIVAACWNNSVYGLASASGKVSWRFVGDVPRTKGVDWIGYQGFHLTPVLHGDRLYAGTRGTRFYAIDAEDGAEVWSSKVGSSWIGSPAVILDEGVYYGLSDGFAVMGFGHDRGAQTLFFRTASPVFAQPEVFGKQLIVGTLAGFLYNVDTGTGQGRMFMHLGPEDNLYREFFRPEVVPDDLSRYQATRWSIDQLLTQANSVLNLTVFDGIAYVGTGTGRLYAVDLAP
jgi:outer membrane protein assembly factor BamB